MQDGDVEEQGGDRDFVASLEKGLLVIEAFDASRPRLTLSDVAKLTGITRAAARRYLLTLTKLNYADFDGRYFSLSPRILRLGYAYLSSASLSARVQPFLEQISEATGESSSAAILDGDDIVDGADGPHGARGPELSPHQWIAAYMMVSSSALLPASSSTIRPWRQTRMRSDRCRISGR